MSNQNYLKIEGEESLVRDSSSNAILNTNNSALEKYRAKRNKDRQIRDDVDMLKSEMSEIKQLLKELVNRGR